MENRKISSAAAIFFFFILAEILHLCHAQRDPPRLYLGAHNRAREEATRKVLNVMRLQPMEWSTLLERYSWEHAFRRRRNCSLLPSGGPFGENLALISVDGAMAGREAVEMWVAEGENYDYGSNSCLRGNICDHYTQIVWRNTTRLGCSRVRCDNGSALVSCNYDPIGNILGQLPF